jgi:hypothetical protein
MAEVFSGNMIETGKNKFVCSCECSIQIENHAGKATGKWLLRRVRHGASIAHATTKYSQNRRELQ